MGIIYPPPFGIELTDLPNMGGGQWPPPARPPPPSLVLASLQVIVAPLLKNLTFDFQFVLQLVWIPATNLATSSQHYSLKKINTIFRKALTDLTKTSKILSWSEWFIHCTWTSELVYCTDYQIQLKGNNRQKGEIGQISIEFLFFSSKLIKPFFQSLTWSILLKKCWLVHVRVKTHQISKMNLMLGAIFQV